MSITAVEETFRRWLHLPDLGPLYALLGAVAANRLEGDPVWLLLVGPPGGGKTELLNTLGGVPDTYPAATITEAALLSGVPRKEHAQGAKGGLLREIGDFGIIVAKDFGSVLSMNRDARALLLAALREVYDGSWTRYVGQEGGRQLHWEGKVGFVGGVTPTIDRHHAVMGAMGERFIFYRLPEADPEQQARRALEHAGKEKQMRAELGEATAALIAEAKGRPDNLQAEDVDRLVSMSTLTVRARSSIERDGYTRDIELVPEPEAPTRIIVVLRRLLQGLDAIGIDRDVSWVVIAKAALDSIPAIRLACLKTLNAAHPAQLDTNEIASQIRYPASTTRRALEDLTAHSLTYCNPDPGKAHRWGLKPFAQARLSSFPEMSVHTYLGIQESTVSIRDGERERVGEHFGKASENGATTPNQPPPDPIATLPGANDDDIPW